MAAAAAASERSDRRSAGRGRERNPEPSDSSKKAAEKGGYSGVHSAFEKARKIDRRTCIYEKKSILKTDEMIWYEIWNLGIKS